MRAPTSILHGQELSSLVVLTLVLSALLGSAAGCVTQGKYDDLKTKYDEASGKLYGANASIAQLERKHAALEAEQQRLIAVLEGERAAHASTKGRAAGELEATRTKLQQSLDAAHTELAQVLKDKGALRESTMQLQEALQDLARRKAQSDRRVAEVRNLLARFKPLIDAGTLRVTIDAGRMVLSLPSDVLFDTGSARVSKVGRQAVSEVAQVLRDDLADRSFQVEGHTDNVPIHNTQYASNWELAAARALGVVKLMVEQGMQPQHLSAASHGENLPAKDNADAAGRAYNRRIEIILVPDLSSLPGFDELKIAIAGS